VEGFDPVFAIADEDLDRESEEKTSAVHFLRFELSDAMVAQLKSGVGLSIGADHPEYPVASVVLVDTTRKSLMGDLH
jgi:hypothetical protein